MKVMTKDSRRFLGAYVCPDAFVSQVVYFSERPDMKWFSDTIAEQVGTDNFTTHDIRLATRHGWELGGQARNSLEAQLGKKAAISEMYWTRYPRTEAEKQIAISLCVGDALHPGCLRLFAHNRAQAGRLCPACAR